MVARQRPGKAVALLEPAMVFDMSSSGGDPRKVQVLVLDDDDRLREVIIDVLESAHYVVAGIATAQDALERFAEFDPDLVVLDMMMPEIDGFEFLARLRANPTFKRVPVLISSALGSTLARAIEERSAAALGIVGVLSKPVEMTTLIEHVRATIGPGWRASG
jgi:CheY-like chemotaxis protein